MSDKNSEPLPEVDEVDFQMACRRFTIRAMITNDRQLPVVDEFLLRMLAIIDDVPVSRLRTWFGFTVGEIQTVLIDLERRAFVEVDGENVRLAPSGRELFRAIPEGGVPRIVEVSPLIDQVWFDLVSRNMVQRSRNRSVDYLVRLQEVPSARELPEAFARDAFEANFRDYARRVRRLPDADSVNIYSISEVEGGTYGYQTLKSKLTFDARRNVVRPTFPELGDEAVRFQKLTIAAAAAWQSLDGPEGAAAVITDYERFTGDRRLEALLKSGSTTDAWRDAIANVTAGDGFRPTLGATYLERNMEALVNSLATARTSDRKAAQILWLRPSGSKWARTLRLGSSLQEMREGLRASGYSDTATTLIMPRATPRPVRRSHRRLFDRGVLLPQGHLPPNLEVVLIEGVCALIHVHVPIGGSAVSIGSLVTDTKRLERIASRLSSARSVPWETVWQNGREQNPTSGPNRLLA